MRKSIALLALAFIMNAIAAQKTDLGAEIWIEPGMTRDQIMEWTRLSSEEHLRDIRIFVMWTHVEPAPGRWDFKVYDWIFEACEKFNLRLQVTLNPNQPAFHYGKEYFGSTHSHSIFPQESMKRNAARYIEKVVERYRNSPALDNWWLMNEPYAEERPTSYILNGFRAEMEKKYRNIEDLNKLWNTAYRSFGKIDDVQAVYNAEWAAAMPYYDWMNYCNKHLTEFQRWVHDEVLKHDTRHGFHTNPGGYLFYFHKQDAVAWRPFINSLGASIHPTWHFNILSNDQYSLGVAACCNLTGNVAAPNPFWVSELSAGNNMNYYCPSPDEIAQWTWIGIAEGAQKIIYWLLNARSFGNESGEWALLDFQNKPSNRLTTVSEIASSLQREKDFFSGAKPVRSNITILLSPETKMTNDRKKKGNIHDFAYMACYQALKERGIDVNLQLTNDFHWSGCHGKAIILPEIITLPTALNDSIKKFLGNGNKIILLGPTGYYNEQEDCMYLKFPLKAEFGAEPKEIQSVYPELFTLKIDGQKRYDLPCNQIFGTLSNITAEIISTSDGQVTGIRNRNNSGEVVWIPSAADVGAWLSKGTGLSQFLADELAAYCTDQPFTFGFKTDLAGLQTMYSDHKYLTVLYNGKKETNKVALSGKVDMKPRIVFCTNKKRAVTDVKQQIELAPKECLVILWE